MARLRSPVVAAVVMLLAATACGEGANGVTEGGSGDSPSSTEPNESVTTTTGSDGIDGELAFGLTQCDPELPRLSADPSFYRDEPIYVGNEQPIEEVRAWASARPGYEDIWIDRDQNGWITVGFTGDATDVAERQAELTAEFPDVGVVAVAVPVTDAELWALRSEIEQELKNDPDLFENWGMGHSVSRGVVELSVPVLSEDYLEPLARFADRPLCVSGADPVDAVADGPQPTAGDGWRLLDEDLTGWAYRTGVATTDDQLAALWAEAGLTGEPPPVDWETEIAIWFGAVYGSSCPIRMDDVVVDADVSVVHGEFVNPGNPTVCSSDANPHAYVVALLRDRLPAAPFAVQLDADDPPRGAPEERTTVLVDLRPPGSVATADDLQVLTLEDVEALGPQVDLFTPGEVIEDGYPWEFRLDLICGVEYIGPLNSVTWRRTPPADGSSPAVPPPAWQQAADDGDTWPIAEFLIESTSPGSDSPRLTVTINGHAEIYEPVPSSDASSLGDQPSC
ncbi:MAG: hypothetical protein OES24_10285 [Acidimicrobiia bacterium]|nr:hypothetical protein [Acidimicrobiia bacterium]